MASELKQRLDESLATFGDLKTSLKVEQKLDELRKLEGEMAKADFWSDQAAAGDTVRRVKGLKASTQPFLKLQGRLEELQTLLELAEEEECEATMKEAETAHEGVVDELERLKVKALIAGPNDHRNAFVNIHAGAGGVDACDWVSMLYRMYQRYCELQGFTIEELDVLPEDEAGYRRVTFIARGELAYGLLRSEIGVHRLVRISPFDAQSRRHTAFAAVDVLPEFEDDIEIDIAESDLRIDTYSAGGPGGQHVNKTQSAVRIVHIPTNIMVQCQNERSQHANRRQAMNLLKARLFRHEEQKRDEELRKLYGEKGEIAWGHQIRSYTLQPFTLVKDHRTGVETSNVEKVLDGDIDAFVEAYLKKRAEQSA